MKLRSEVHAFLCAYWEKTRIHKLIVSLTLEIQNFYTVAYWIFVIYPENMKVFAWLLMHVIVSPVRSTYGGYYGLVVVTPPPRPQTLHRSHDNLKNPYRIASIFYM